MTLRDVRGSLASFGPADSSTFRLGLGTHKQRFSNSPNHTIARLPRLESCCRFSFGFGFLVSVCKRLMINTAVNEEESALRPTFIGFHREAGLSWEGDSPSKMLAEQE